MRSDDVSSFLESEFVKLQFLGSEPSASDPTLLLDTLDQMLPRQGKRSESYVQQLRCQHPGRRTLTAALLLLNSQSDEVLAGPPFPISEPCLAAVIRSGFLRLNLTGIVVLVIAVDEASCTLRISAVAREGVISQKSARKAVQRFVAELEATLATTPSRT